MTDGSVRSHRRATEQLIRPKKSRKCFQFLLSACLFFTILSACLIAALVFIGKHNYYNDPKYKLTTIDVPKHMISRLPRDVAPIHYDITLKPNLITGQYKGSVNISINVINDTNEVILHSKHLKILQVELYKNTSLHNKPFDAKRKVDVHDVNENVLDEVITVTFKEILSVGKYSIFISFTGNLVNRTSGFYLSQYFDKKKNETRKIATSKFEPTYARQAFPCFDEPNLKANYTVHLLKPNDDYIALSNMPEEPVTTPTDDGIMVHFQTSVKMSTYLACFIVSDFTATSGLIESDLGNIPFRVFATPAQLDKTEYAKKVGKDIMEYYLTYFNIPFPLPKLDMVAIPDFVSGAMEHWGLVTFRETALLYDPSISSSANQQRVASVVAHELAHSWFGNLVTMDWWNDLWLNEGFASYIEYKGVNAAEPDWQMLNQILVEDVHPVLILDATLGSHPIVQTVVTPNQITEIFDTISYNKGASVLRMLEGAVGEEIFQRAVKEYLEAFAYGNAVTNDLLEKLQGLVPNDLDIKDMMNTWTLQMGFPIINLEKTAKGFKLTQKRFLTDPDAIDNTQTKYNYKYTIPITFITKDNKIPELQWFNHTDEFVDIETNSDWIKFNHHQTGYYRVNYPEENWNQLIDNIKGFDVADRVHLLEESFRIAGASQLPYHIPLNMTKYLESDYEYLIWSVAATMLKEIKQYLTTSASLSDYKAYVVKIVQNAYDNYTWDEKDEDDHLRKRGRVTVLDLACSMGHASCLENANDLFDKWLQEQLQLGQNLRELVYVYGMSAGTNEQWKKLWDKFVAEGDAGEKLKLLRGVCSINDISTLTSLLDMATDETYIRKQDYFTFMGYVSRNPVGTNLVWDYVREHWLDLVDRFTINERYLGNMIPTITSQFSTRTKKDEMEAFFAKYPDAGAGAAARIRALETVENNIKWLERNKESVESWIQQNTNKE